MRFGYEKINTMEITPGDLEQMRRDQWWEGLMHRRVLFIIRQSLWTDIVPVRHTDQSVTVHFKPFSHKQIKITGYISLQEDQQVNYY